MGSKKASCVVERQTPVNAETQRMFLSASQIDRLRSGQTVLIRLGSRHKLKRGDVVFFSGVSSLMANITDIKYIPLCKLSDETAVSAGYDGVSGFLKSWSPYLRKSSSFFEGYPLTVITISEYMYALPSS